MQPLHELLARIRWDPAFGRGDFELAYLDKVAGTLLRVPLRDIRFDQGDHFAFQLVDAEGAVQSIPFHRVRAVYRDGRPIWQRPDRPRPHHAAGSGAS